MSHLRELDGFQILSGVLTVIAGPIMLLSGAPAGWAFITIAAGGLVLLAQWALVAGITFEQPDTTHVVLCVVGMLFLGLAVVYLTRAANDLPTFFPGHDADSENFRVMPGVLLLTVGAVAVARAVASFDRPAPFTSARSADQAGGAKNSSATPSGSRKLTPEP